MKLLILGGFLGSGKTTVLRKLLPGIIKHGKTAAIIENEIGKIGIDDTILESTGLSVTPLFGGCVCCQITGDLLEAINRIQLEVSPDILIIEMTGLALLSNLKEKILNYGHFGLDLVSVLDISRWEIQRKVMLHFLESQLKGADVILINKTDLTPLTEETRREIQRMSSGAEIVEVAVLEKDGLWDSLVPLLPSIGGDTISGA